MNIVIKVPPQTQQTFTVDVFGHPEVYDSQDDDQFVDDQSVEHGCEETSKEEEDEDNSFEEAVEDKS